MFSLSRNLFAFLLLTIGGIFIFFHFHDAISVVTSTIVDHLKIANERISITALNNNYSVTIKQGKPQASIPKLPDLSQFTVENVAEMVPVFSTGKVTISSMEELPALREFIKKDGRVQHQRISQLAVMPQAIYIQSGYYDLKRLYEEVKALTTENVIEKIGTRYLLRLPILIGEEASLTISGTDTDELLLSQERAVFIANAGELFILRTKVTGWNEKDNHPAFFKDKFIFRPFLVSWSGARMYIAGSTIASLGYHRGKSYGVTYSSCESCIQVTSTITAAATGHIIGSTFSDLYYGFYSYEAEDVVIVGNTYIDNAIYGIDPHDRSRHLLIAGNEVYGSKKKHGIIISREVKDSWIFNNYSHHNQGSGIMLDRSCENNIIAYNIFAYNAGDGMAVFESYKNTSYNNKIYQNEMSGIRIRNSWDIRIINDNILDNGGVPIIVYSLSLESHKDRDIEEDPYSIKADAIISGIVIKQLTDKPALKIDGIDSLVLSDIHFLSSGPVFSGRLFSDETDIKKNIDTPERMVTIAKKSLLITPPKIEAAP